MKLVGEIREYFASLPTLGIRKIKNLLDTYPAYVIRIPGAYGVAVEVDENLIVSENFNSIKLCTKCFSINGKVRKFLILCSAFEEFRYEFASVCAEFVDPGENGSNRIMLLTTPHNWWKKWKELMGNTNYDIRAYNVIAEMLVLNYKLKTDSLVEWTATRMGSHDIECTDESCEVKSTVKRYSFDITISSQHQLDHVKKLYLYFCRLEESREGVSINDMKEILVKNGYDQGKLELELERQGFERGASIRDKKYKVLEKRKYEVDDSFPKIVQESFKDGKYPSGITRIEYTVNLEGIKYTTW